MKRSSKGKAYFYAMGQRDRLTFKESMNTYAVRYRKIDRLDSWAINAYLNGYNGY